MQRWSATLQEEIAGWPEVTSKPMFGMLAFYRGAHIFAALPKTRAAGTPFSLLMKLPGARGDRLARGGPGHAWVTFAMESDDDLAVALDYLSRAYDRAAVTARGRRRRSSEER